MVVIAAPHTSNWDFVFGIAAMFAIGVRVSWIGKHTIFRWHSGWIMRWLGGLPVDRSVSGNIVGSTVDIIDGREKLLVAVSPEGTRKKVARWKTGFYHIAKGAGIPILLIYFDYSKKVIGFGPLFEPTGDIDRDLPEIQAFYAGVPGKYPEKFQQDMKD